MAETRKKRKLGTDAQAQAPAGRPTEAPPADQSAAAAAPAMSAFALRKRLLQKAEAEAAEAAATSSTSEDGSVTPEKGPEPAEEPAVPPAKTRRELPLQRSTFRATKHNCQRRPDGTTRLKMTEGERLVILGSYGITVHSGAVTVTGATLAADGQTHWVHAPLCHALPVVRCASDTAGVTLTSHPAAAALRRLERLGPLFGQLWNDSDGSFQILYTPEDGTARAQGLVSAPEWNKLLAELSRQAGAAVYFVCGPKSSGKSTFSRLLANRLLSRRPGENGRGGGVAVLDIDPGQPEFGTPGMLSLVRVGGPNLAPPFCHPAVAATGDWQRLRAHDIAATSLAGDPEHYVACVADLFATYVRTLQPQGCVLVVNTPGWVLGTGRDVLVELLQRLRPARIVYMSQDGPEETVQGLRAAYENVPMTTLPSQPAGGGAGALRTAQHLRAMQTMSYLHLSHVTGYGPGLAGPPGGLGWDATSLAAVRPWVVPYDGLSSGILGVLCVDGPPPPALLADAVCGTVVAIVAVERAAALSIADGAPLPVVRSPSGLPCLSSGTSGTGDASVLDPRHSHALGVALIRGIDTTARTLLLLTPLKADVAVAEVLRQGGLGVVLVSGRLDAPTWAYTEDLYRQGFEAEDDGTGDYGADTENVPWVEVLRGGEKKVVGSQVWRVRRNLGRSNND